MIFLRMHLDFASGACRAAFEALPALLVGRSHAVAYLDMAKAHRAAFPPSHPALSIGVHPEELSRWECEQRFAGNGVAASGTNTVPPEGVEPEFEWGAHRVAGLRAFRALLHEAVD